MVETVINTIISYIIPLILGYLICLMKSYREREKMQQEALKCLLRSNITSKYYVYTELKEIPLYEKENINYMYEQYIKMKGNSYVGGLVEEINRLQIKK